MQNIEVNASFIKVDGLTHSKRCYSQTDHARQIHSIINDFISLKYFKLLCY